MYPPDEIPTSQEDANVNSNSHQETHDGYIDYRIHIQDNVYTPIEKYSIMLEEIFHSKNVGREASRAIRFLTNKMLNANLGNWN